MKPIYIFVSVLTIASSYARELVPDEIDQKIRDTVGWSPSDNKDLSWITDEIRPIVISRLKEKGERLRKESLNPYADYEVEGQLISIGHRETIEKYVGKIGEPTYPSPLERYSTEVAIPYLMPLVYGGSMERPVSNSDVGYSSPRDHAAYMVLRIINNRKVFPADGRKWADKMTQHLGQPLKEERIGLLKQWWEKNQAAILAKRYSDATWLPALYKGEPSYFGLEETDERLAKQEQRKISDRSSRQPTEKSPEIVKNPSSGSLWITVAALGVLLTGWLGWKLKHPRQS